MYTANRDMKPKVCVSLPTIIHLSSGEKVGESPTKDWRRLEMVTIAPARSAVGVTTHTDCAAANIRLTIRLRGLANSKMQSIQLITSIRNLH